MQMRYEDYVNLSFKPSKEQLLTKLYLEAEDIKHAAGGIAAESSIGTWKTVSTEKSYMQNLAATVFSWKKHSKGAIIEIAYPLGLFEESNMPNILSSIAGNIFGLAELHKLILLDITFPNKIINSFPGPKYGIDGIRKIMKITKRPFIGTIVKPKIGLRTVDHAQVAFDSWAGGCDIVKDDENLSSQSFNKFESRLKETFKMKEKAEKITGEKKGYLINITAETREMLRRAKLVEDIGNEYAMIDLITLGWAAVETVRNEDFDLIIHGHRAGHAAMTRSKDFGISMKVLAKVSRILGTDQLHVGAAVGKMSEDSKEVLKNISAIKEGMGIKKSLPVASGGLSTIKIPDVVKIFGNDVVIQMGGGIHGHPKGTFAGAKAARQALDATMQGISLNEYAKAHIELKEALS